MTAAGEVVKGADEAALAAALEAVAAGGAPAEVPEHHFVVPKPVYALTSTGEVNPVRTAQLALHTNWNM